MTQIPINPDSLSKVSSSTQTQGKSQTNAPSGVFSQILADQLGETYTEAPQDQGLPELEAQLPLNRLQALADPAPDRLISAGNDLASALDRLDTYAQTLADPDKTLREAAEILDTLSGEIADLQSRMGDSSDPDLNGILSHLSTLVAVERVKMDRGDYL